MLVNRQVSSKEVIGTVDGNLLLLLAGLCVVNAALAQTGMPQKVVHDLQGAGVDFANPSILFLVASALSNIVGNNPAVMLLAPFLPHAANTEALGATDGHIRAHLARALHERERQRVRDDDDHGADVMRLAAQSGEVPHDTSSPTSKAGARPPAVEGCTGCGG